MAVPTTLSVSTRCQYTGSVSPPPVLQLFSGAGPVAVPPMQSAGVAPIPAGNPPPAAPDTVGTGPLPAICIQAGATGPDYLPNAFMVFDADGTTKVRRNVVSATTWASQGSNPAVARLAMVDALS